MGPQSPKGILGKFPRAQRDAITRYAPKCRGMSKGAHPRSCEQKPIKVVKSYEFRSETNHSSDKKNMLIKTSIVLL